MNGHRHNLKLKRSLSALIAVVGMFGLGISLDSCGGDGGQKADGGGAVVSGGQTGQAGGGTGGNALDAGHPGTSGSGGIGVIDITGSGTGAGGGSGTGGAGTGGAGTGGAGTGGAGTGGAGTGGAGTGGAGTGGAGTGGAGGSTATPTTAQVQAILNANCIGCHGGGSPSAGLDWTNVRFQIGMAAVGCPLKIRIVSGDSVHSYMVDKIKGAAQDGGCFLGVQMPRNAPPLSISNIALIVAWINGNTPQ